MTPGDAQTDRVLLTATSPEGDRVELVAYGGGACGVLRNGTPVPGLQWEPCRVEAATEALVRLARLD
jgi:hypothetical protein